MLTAGDGAISRNALLAAVPAAGKAQKQAVRYVAASHFRIGFRDSAAKASDGWLLEMMEGCGRDAPKSFILTDKASHWQRLKHKARKFRHKWL